MPEIIPIITTIISGLTSAAPAIGAAAGLAGLGETLYSAANPPGAPKSATATPQQTQANAQATKTAQEASLTNAFPNIQALTGGSLSPEAWLQLSQLVTGQANSPGIGAASQDILTKLTGSPTAPFQVSAGNTPGSPTYSGTGLVAGATYA